MTLALITGLPKIFSEETLKIQHVQQFLNCTKRALRQTKIFMYFCEITLLICLKFMYYFQKAMKDQNIEFKEITEIDYLTHEYSKEDSDNTNMNSNTKSSKFTVS